MGRFDNGITAFTAATLDNYAVYFPEKEVKCRWCPFISHYDSLDRDKCSLTHEILFTREFVGQRCPLTILNTIKTEDMN